MPDMYAFQSGSKPQTQNETEQNIPQLTPNILPCQIHHDGPIESTDRFWTPVADAEGTSQTSHFRGRKLRGRRVAIPEGYEGVVALPTDRTLQVPPKEDVEIAEAPVKILETQGTFDEVIVWEHENLPAADDIYVKGVEEWMRFAETMHGTSEVSNGKE